MSNIDKQSSVDILCQKLANKLGLQAITFYIDHQEEIAEAKAMHKEEIEQAFYEGENNSVDYFDPENRIKEYEQYYNETFNK
jgi:hypothetical protein